MWLPEFMEQMLAVVRNFEHRGVLQKVYCCDVTLRPLKLNSSRMTGMTGNGGTEWTTEHHDQILKDLGLDSNLTIFYLTDEYVEFLDEALEDPRVDLKIINIPRCLGWE